MKRKNEAPSAQRNKPALTRGQRWTFRILALLSPLLLLAVVELFLRLAGVGHPTAFFLKQRLNGRDVLTDNPHFGERFFPAGLARTPQPVVLAPRPAPGTIRIFVLGESAAMGDPEPAFGLPRMLQAMLELKFPSNQFEVINVAMTAINSHVIREIARDCAPLKGDVWVIYMGNNEVVGPFGGGTVFGKQVPNMGFIRASLWLKQFRFVQWLSSLGRRGPVEWGGMEMFLQQQVQRDDPRMARVHEHFRENLDEVIRVGRQSGAKVVVGTVAVNLRDCPPFASKHRALTAQESPEFERRMALGLALAGSNRFVEAQAIFSQGSMQTGARGADEFAELYFQRARCELALGSHAVARTNFNRAKEFDTLRFRADDGINEAIRAHARTSGRPELFAEVERVVAAASSNAIPGAEFFYEHVHFTFEGNYALARAFFEEIVRTLPTAVTKNAAAGFPAIEDCAGRLAWTDWDRLQVFEEVQKRLQQPPFTTQFGHTARDVEWTRLIEELGATLTPKRVEQIKEQYHAALRRAPDDWVLHENFAKLLEAQGETALAMEQWAQVARLLPHETQAPYHLGNLLDAAGRSGEALPFFRAALLLDPARVEARNGLALALASLGRTSEAEREWQTALRLKPKSAEARVNLGQFLAQQGRTDEALVQYELALRHDTNNAAAHVNLGKLLNQRGDRAGAMAHYESALRINPKNAVAHYNLGNALRTDRPAEAARHYAEAVRANPKFAEAQFALAMELAWAGNTSEAQIHFAEAVRLQPAFVEAHLNYGVLLARLGKFAEAAQEFSTTLKLQPAHPQAQEFLRKAKEMAH